MFWHLCAFNLWPGVVIAPLPAEKHSLGASDAITWRMGNEKKAPLPVEFGLSKVGHLVRIGRGETTMSEGDSLGRCSPYETWLLV